MSEFVEQQDAGTILMNPLVLERIMKCLNTKDLLQASLVKKTWNQEARCILRDRRTCMAVITAEKPCVRAKGLNDLLGTMTVIPYNGLSIAIETHQCNSDLCERSTDQVYENLLKMPLKFLEFTWTAYGKAEKCPLGQFILRLMARSLKLEEMRIQEMPMKIKLEKGNAPTDGLHELPKLKILKLPEDQLEDLLRANLVKVLSARAPNLEELQNVFYPELIDLVPVDKQHIIKNLYISCDEVEDQEFLNQMRKFCASRPKLHTLTAHKPRFVNEDAVFGDYLQTFFRVIYWSYESLENLTLDHWTAIMFQIVEDGISLPNVKTLHFVMSGGKKAGIAWSLLRTPLAKLFPLVKSVQFSTGPFEFQQGMGLVEEDEPKFPWLAVDKVDLGDSDLNEQTVTEIGILFPKLRNVVTAVSCKTPNFVLFQQIWSSWSALHGLAINGKLEIPWNVNFDAAFCGIWPEEAEPLQKKDEEFLRAVNIVPTFPAINCVRDLKSFRMQVETQSVSPPGSPESPSQRMFLSKVTQLIAFRHMPDLVFQLTAPYEAAQHFDHLKPFIKLDLLPPNPTRAVNASEYMRKMFFNMPALDPQFFASLSLALSADNENDDEDDGAGIDFSEFL